MLGKRELNTQVERNKATTEGEERGKVRERVAGRERGKAEGGTTSETQADELEFLRKLSTTSVTRKSHLCDHH